MGYLRIIEIYVIPSDRLAPRQFTHKHKCYYCPGIGATIEHRCVALLYGWNAIQQLMAIVLNLIPAKKHCRHKPVRLSCAKFLFASCNRRTRLRQSWEIYRGRKGNEGQESSSNNKILDELQNFAVFSSAVISQPLLI